jgi:hypothetical protein
MLRKENIISFCSWMHQRPEKIAPPCAKFSMRSGKNAGRLEDMKAPSTKIAHTKPSSES